MEECCARTYKGQFQLQFPVESPLFCGSSFFSFSFLKFFLKRKATTMQSQDHPELPQKKKKTCQKINYIYN